MSDESEQASEQERCFSKFLLGLEYRQDGRLGGHSNALLLLSSRLVSQCHNVFSPFHRDVKQKLQGNKAEYEGETCVIRFFSIDRFVRGGKKSC